MSKLEIFKAMHAEVVAEQERLNAELSIINELIAIHMNSGTQEAGDRPIRYKFSPTISKSSAGIMRKAIALALEMYDSESRIIITGEVLAGLAARGLIVGGKSPSANVSSYLHHSEELANIRGHGWVRKRDLSMWVEKLGGRDSDGPTVNARPDINEGFAPPNQQ